MSPQLARKMKLLKVLNNSALIAKDNEGEYLVLGRGISFNRKPDEILDPKTEIEQVFALTTASRYFQKVMDGHRPEIVDLVIKTVQEFMFKADEIDVNALVAFCDHIATMFERVEKNEDIQNPFLLETKTLYPESYRLVETMIARISEKFKVNVPEAEVGYIALHMQNITRQEQDVDVKVLNKIVVQVLDYLSEEKGFQMDKNSIRFAQFITHLKFLAMRQVRKERANNEMTEVILKQFPQYQDLALEIAEIINGELDSKLNRDEIAYLMMHLHRFSVNQA